MGILNVTPDSFSDGGLYLQPEKAYSRAMKMVEEGADIIDVGGVSTRPGSHPVSLKEEMQRVIPVVEKLAKKKRLVLSIDTFRSKVAEECLQLGADMINDVTALRGDPRMAEVVARYKIPVVLMHMQGTPRTMQMAPTYTDVIKEISDFLKERIRFAVKEGVDGENILVDPGIGFGKTVPHNLEIFKNLEAFKSLGKPIVLGPSRKSVIGKVLDLPTPERLEGTAAVVAIAVWKGVNILRVHDVKPMARVVQMAYAITQGINFNQSGS